LKIVLEAAPVSDVFDKQVLSEIMRAVKSKNTKSTEIKLQTIFKKYNITGWRKNYPVKGRPDFVFLEKKVAIFVDGCFWHGHDCRNTRPQNNAEYWRAKRERNQKRDKEISEKFMKRGWIVLRIWECGLKKKNESKLMEKIRNSLN
jgi:DNA mismatch endonuclease (patch repair protein)